MTRESPQSNSPGPTGTSPPAARPAHPWSPDEEELARLIIRQNENWLYVRDAQGNFLKGPDGRRVLTPLGQRYAAYVAQALDRGIRSPTEQHHFALTKLAAESQAAEAIVKHPPLVTAMPDARAYPNLGALRVAVFADGVFCEQVAQDVLLANRIVESKLDAADVILVVVRDPLPIVWLRDRYDSPAKLKEDVKRQLNLAGDKGHVLVYWIEPSLQVKQVFAGSEDWETLELIRTRRRN